MDADEEEEQTDGHRRSKVPTNRPLPFWSEKVDVFFKKLDDLAANEKKKSTTSRMMIQRKIGPPSGRILPDRLQFTAWAYN